MLNGGRWLLVLGTCASALLGCSDDPTATGVDSSFATELPLLAPRYALEIEATVTGVHHDTGEETTKVTHIAGTADVAQDGGALDLRLGVCRITLPPAGDHQPAFDEDFIRDRERVDWIDVAGSLSKEDDVVRLSTKPLQLLLGITGLDADGSAPEDPEDARVIDQDDDSDPGVSVEVGPGRVFIGLGATMSLMGELDGETGELAGGAILLLDTATYGDSIWMYDARAAAQQEDATHDYEMSASFTLTPADEQLDCDALDDE